MPDPTEPPVQYLFIVARNHPEILARVRERLGGDPRTEIIVDRRLGERRKSTAPLAPDRRRSNRRRPTKYWDDLSVYPTLVAQKHVESYAELQQAATTSASESAALRAENARLRDEIASLQCRLEALTKAEAALRGDAAAVVARTDAALASLAEKLRAFVHDRDRAGKATQEGADDGGLLHR